jgi:hypothetical protein
MKYKTPIIKFKAICLISCLSVFFNSCEKGLESKVFGQFSASTFFQTPSDAQAAVTASYRGMFLYNRGYNSGNDYVRQSCLSTGELTYDFVNGGIPYSNLDLKEDNSQLTNLYIVGMPIISDVTIDIDKISEMQIDDNLKTRYIAELKALRAHYTQMLVDIYGPVPIRVDPSEAQDPSTPPIPRPTLDDIYAQIERDYTEAAAVLPVTYTSADDYGRMTKGVCFTGLLNLYMSQKRWSDAINIGHQIQGLNVYHLIPNYSENFSVKNKGGNSEIILAIPARIDLNANGWFEPIIPSNFKDPGGSIVHFNGYLRMPWSTYDKFDPNDKRLEKVYAKWTTWNNTVYDARANGDLGAVAAKYTIDPTSTQIQQAIDYVIWRYSDVMLLLAEAINENGSGPDAEAYQLINAVRNRAGLTGYLEGSLSKEQFRQKLQDERLFELWCENAILKKDMIRWGTFIQNAINNGSQFAKPEFTVYPLPRSVITQSNGVIKQNPGY